jgi:hypothetical protein
MAVEEHGMGRQCVRFRVWPKLRRGLPVIVVSGLLAAAAVNEGAWLAGAILGAASVGLAAVGARECGCAQGAVLRALERLGAVAGSRASHDERSSAAAVAPGLHA